MSRIEPTSGEEWTAGPADASRDEQLFQETMRVLDEPQAENPLGTKITIFVASVGLFALTSYWFGWSLQTLLLLSAVLLLHELGHYAGMLMFGYRDRQMFFVPFFGAAVSGTKHAAPVWQELIMLLLGPMPGLLLGLALAQVFASEPRTLLGQLVVLLIVINAINLLPFKPLDGGRIVNLLFFARSPWLAAIFHLIAAAGIAALAWVLWSWVFALLALIMLLTVQGTFASTRDLVRTAADKIALPTDLARLDDGHHRALFARALRLSPDSREPAALASRVRGVHEAMVARQPTRLTVAAFTLVYLFGVGLAGTWTYSFLDHTQSNTTQARAQTGSVHQR